MHDDFHEIVLSVKNLTVKLKIQDRVIKVVDNLSYDIAKGKTLAIVGESGCGKSMSAQALMGIISKPPLLEVEGEVWFKGKNLLKMSEKDLRMLRGKKMAMIFQDVHSALNPVFTIGSQLMEVCFIHDNLSEEEAYIKVIESLEEVGIANPRFRFDLYPHEISGGMKQRVSIAMALLGSPDLLIADEPTTALDVSIQLQVLDLIKELQKKRGMSLILITHDIGVVKKMADECLVMYAAQGIEKAALQLLFENPMHPYTEALLKARPTHEIPRGHLISIKGSVPSLDNLPSGCRFNARCPYVMDRCMRGNVPTFEISGNEEKRFVRCWLRE
jgi:peptide/nickel transport system ATP-binding protein